VLPALCLTQIASWGVLYYAFPVLLGGIAADTGWSRTVASAGLSGALLVSALVGIPLGRVLDRRGPRLVMTVGSVVAVVAVAGLAAAPDLAVFLLVWALAGVAMAATFFPAAFVAIIGWWGDRAVGALAVLTLVSGLSSTVFAPLTAWLVGHLSWRSTYLVLAAVLAVVTVPAHAIALRAPWPVQAEGEAAPTAASAARGPLVTRQPGFILLAAGFTLNGFVLFAGLIALVPLLLARGASPTVAAWALGLGGAGQVVGRLGYTRLRAHTTATARTVLLVVAAAILAGALALVPGPLPLLVVLGAGSGTAQGMLTLERATAVPDRWGGADYGRLSAVLAAPVTVASACAPFAATALARPVGGYPRLYLLLAGLGVLAVVLVACARPARGPDSVRS
jgi:MFS family permease